jgi:hypothetical protein
VEEDRMVGNFLKVALWIIGFGPMILKLDLVVVTSFLYSIGVVEAYARRGEGRRLELV